MEIGGVSRVKPGGLVQWQYELFAVIRFEFDSQNLQCQ